MESRGRILEIYRYTYQRAVGGFKGGRGYSRNHYGYFNGYGSFCSYPETHLILKAKIYETNEVASIDIKYLVNGKQLTKKFIEQLNDVNAGKKVWFEGDWGDWNLSDDDDIEW